MAAKKILFTVLLTLYAMSFVQAQTTPLEEELLAGYWECTEYDIALSLKNNKTYDFTYPDGTKLNGWYLADLPGIELENSASIIPIYYTILVLTNTDLKIQTGDENYPELSFKRKKE